MIRNRFVVGLAAAIFLERIPPSWAAQPVDYQFYQEEAKVVIATQREQTLEEAPSIVSVITRHDIEAYGARDLADILRSVPGFEFGVDVVSLAGLSFRGIWVHEGKSLLMIDGITQNDLGFGNYDFFGSIPASIIEKVEIIRGPGSAVYGGFAEEDVINVITHQAASLNGIRASGDVGVVGHGGFSRYGNVSYGSQTDALRVSAHVGYGLEPLSRRDYTDFFGNRLAMNEDTEFRRWQHILTEGSAKNLTVRYQRTSFTIGAQDGLAPIIPPINGFNQQPNNNYNDVTHFDYKAKLSDRLTLQPVFEYTRNNTFAGVFPAAKNSNFEGPGVTLWRYRGEMSALYEAPWDAHVTLGGGYIRDDAQNVDTDGTPGLQLSGNPADVAFNAHTSSAYGLFQYLQRIKAVSLTVGGRYEDTSFGRAFAPRAGITFVHDDLNAKLLYGRAFRIPLPWQAFSRNFVSNPDLKPETANTTEMELGYKFTRHMSGKVNAFFIDIDQPIVFVNPSYVNFGEIQSEGVETEIRADYAHGGGFANASYSTPGHDTSPGFVTQSKKQFLASPPIKIDVGVYRRIGVLEVAPSVTYLSHRAGQSSDSANDPNGSLGTTDYNALFLANLNITARNVVSDFDIHVAFHNIFDTRYVLIQPYYGAHAPLPAQDREIDLGITWHL